MRTQAANRLWGKTSDSGAGAAVKTRHSGSWEGPGADTPFKAFVPSVSGS